MTKNCFYGVLLVSVGIVAVIGCAPTETNPQAPAPSANDHDDHDGHDEDADHDEQGDPKHADHDGHDEHDSHDEHADHDKHADHDHDDLDGHESPHGGELIELGNSHLYHAELVENDSEETIEVYLLDRQLEPLPIAATSITFNLVVEGSPKSFPLEAVEAQDGKASHFRATPSELFELLHVPGVKGRLSVTIEGTPYTGKVEHNHTDHE